MEEDDGNNDFASEDGPDEMLLDLNKVLRKTARKTMERAAINSDMKLLTQ